MQRKIGIIYIVLLALAFWVSYIWCFFNPAEELPLVHIESNFITLISIASIAVFLTYCALLLSIKQMENRDNQLFCSGVLFAVGLFLLLWYFTPGALVLGASGVLRPRGSHA